MPTLNAAYDYVAIVDFLPDADRTQHQLAQRLMKYLAKNGVEQNCLTCNTSGGFVQALRWLAAESQAGRKYFIQFIGHGLVSGLVMPDGKETSWRLTSSLLRKITPETITHSVLNMTCCFGINGIQVANYLTLDNCFFGILGPSLEISFHDGYKLNTKIYKKLLADTPVNQIIREVNQEFSRGRGNEILYGITASGYRDLRAARH